MKNKTIALVMTAAMAATVLAGCGGTSSSSTPTTSSKTPATSSTAPATSSTAPATSSTTTETKKVELLVWSPQEDQAGDNWLGTMCDAFNAAHPEWDITFKYGVCSESDAKGNMTDPEAGADVYMFANDHIPALVAAGALAELGGTTVEQIKANNDETTVATVTYKDAIYGVPFTSNTWFMYYNKDKFSEDDVKSLDTMLEKGVVSFPLNNSWYFVAPYAANGCTLFGEDGMDEAAGIQFGGEAGTAATKALVALVANKNFRNDANGSGLSGFGDGSVDAFFSGSWNYNDALEQLDGDASKLGICPAPTMKIDGEDKQLKAFAGSKVIGVNPHCKNPDVAVALAAYLGGTEGQKAHYEMRKIIPTDKNVDVSDDILAQTQIDVMNNKRIIQPVLPAMDNYWGPAESMGNQIIDKAVTEENAADETEKMNKTMNSSGI